MTSRGAFVNWAGTASSTPRCWSEPASESEVVAVVRRAAAEGRQVRVVGAGHSFSRIAVPHDEAMSLDRLVVPGGIDRERGEVTVSGGMRLRDLISALAAAGLALPVVGSISAQAVAGAIATGTHGSSLEHGNLASLVTRLRLVTGTGELLDIPGDDPRLDGARVHLGALGVVTQVTLQVRPTGRLEQTVEHVPVDVVADRLLEVASSAEYVKVWWLPHAPVAQVVRYRRTTDPLTRRPTARTARWIDERVMHRYAFPALVHLQSRRPGITAGVNTRLARVYLGAARQVGPDMLMLNTPMPLRHRETEAALPLAEAPAAVRDLLPLFAGGRHPANFPLEIRFVRGDTAWLSPAFSQEGGDTCQIGAYTTDSPHCDPYFDAFWELMRARGARPHWGKELHHTATQLRPLYPQLDAFTALRDELDPERVFGSPFLTQVLGS